MSIEDRDWYRGAYKEKEKKYGSDFGAAKKRQEAADSMWAEVKPSHSGGGTPPKKPTKTMTAEPPTNGDDVVLVPSLCTNCGATFQVRVKRKDLANYSYKCLKCGYAMTQTTKPKTDSKDVIALLVSAVLPFLASYLIKIHFSGLVLIAMLIYNVGMVLTIYTKKPPTSNAMRIWAFIVFIFSEWYLGMITYGVFFM